MTNQNHCPFQTFSEMQQQFLLSVFAKFCLARSSTNHQSKVKPTRRPTVGRLSVYCRRVADRRVGRRLIGIGFFIFTSKSFIFKNVVHPHDNEKPRFSNSSGTTIVFEMLPYHDELMWTTGLTVQIKCVFKFLRFSVDLPGPL